MMTKKNLNAEKLNAAGSKNVTSQNGKYKISIIQLFQTIVSVEIQSR